MKILLTTTSFQDTPGQHQELLDRSGFDIVRARGPLSESQLLDILAKEGPFDGLLNGDDQLNAKVIDALLPQLKVIAKYGIGLDSIDVQHATLRRVPVLFTPGVNETAVAEHTIGLMIAVAKHFWFHVNSVKNGHWSRLTGRELWRKTLGIVGSGRIAREVAKRCSAFDMKILAYGSYWEPEFLQQYHVSRVTDLSELFAQSDVISLNTNLNEKTRGMINQQSIEGMKDGVIIVNTARGALVVEQDIVAACNSGKVHGYGSDVLEYEPVRAPHVFETVANIIITPHVGSRTYESVQRQGLRAAANLVNFFKGDPDYIQANKF